MLKFVQTQMDTPFVGTTTVTLSTGLCVPELRLPCVPVCGYGWHRRGSKAVSRVEILETALGVAGRSGGASGILLQTRSRCSGSGVAGGDNGSYVKANVSICPCGTCVKASASITTCSKTFVTTLTMVFLTSVLLATLIVLILGNLTKEARSLLSCLKESKH